MKFFSSISRILATFAMVCTFAFSCQEPEVSNVGDFDIKIKEVSADYVDVIITAPHKVDVAYMVTSEPMATTPAVLFKSGTGSTIVTVEPGQELRITENLVQDSDHYLYAAAMLDAKNYSKIIELQFKTESYNFTDLITVVDTYNDGFKVHITVPKETKEKGNVIRYGSTSQAFYNLMKYQKGGERGVDLNAIAANGDPYSMFVKNDSTIVVNDDNIIKLDENGDPVLDEQGQPKDIHDPIAPGEPTIFLAGECRWGSPDEYAAIMGFHLPETHSYSIPLYDHSKGWTGAFDKITFKTAEPASFDADFEIRIPDDEIEVIDAIVYFDKGENVTSYFYMIVDNATYNEIKQIYLDGNEDWYQWFLTSYIAFYEWGVMPLTETTFVHAGASFQGNYLVGGEDYHVLVTAFGDEDGMKQKFFHKQFKAKDKTKVAPVIEVTAVNTDDPYVASFNVKAPNKDLAGSYWGCNYSREFELMFNLKKTYEDILYGNYMFAVDEIAAINSDAGLTVSFPTLDGEVTRFAAYGCNDEYTFNQIDPAKEGKGWADYHAPMAAKKDPVTSTLFDELQGDWTATATIIAKEQADDGSIVSYNIPHSSKVTVSGSAPELPAALDNSVYALYSGKSKDEVDGMFEELGILTDQFTEYRLEGQNRLLCNGFIDFDYHKNPGRMTFRSPYDLFIAQDYSSVDVPMLMYDFGPKWFLEVCADGKVIVPFNSTYLPPMLNWPGYPFYVGGVGSGMAFYDATEEYPGFPVEISADRNTMTIKPIVVGSDTFYMNALGLSGTTGQMEIIATIISEIVLTRGWKETASSAAPAYEPAPSMVQAVTIDGSPVTELPQRRVFKSMTDFSEGPRMDCSAHETPNIVTMKMVEETTAKLLKKYNLE